VAFTSRASTPDSLAPSSDGTQAPAWVESWRARREAEYARDAQVRALRRAEAVRAAAVLRGFPGVTSVVLFGSLARDEATSASDVNVFVEGLAESDWLAAVSAVRSVISRAEVDLVRAETASASLRARVLAEGVSLFGP